MYSIESLWRGIKNPKLVLREFNKFYYTRFGHRKFNPNGANVLEEDWDNLIILDACRYDTFLEVNNLPGTLEYRISRGSCSAEFLEGNFKGRELHDTVYVNSNPFLEKINLDAEFHSVLNLWKSEGWDEEYGTVLPGVMTQKAQEIADKFPEKRLIIHYMQPHYPFIGGDTRAAAESLQAGVDELAPWRKIFTGQESLPVEEVRKAYHQNLEHVLTYIEELLEHLSGRTVVTSDHGNMFGERALPLPITEWGHPCGLYVEPLVKVPWFVYESGNRPEIITEEPKERKEERAGEEEIKRKLENLGYL